METKVFRVAALFGFLLLSVSVSSAETYYVSLTGNDNADGKAEKSAFRTFRKGVSVLKAGDTLIIKSGDYGNDTAVVSNSGTKDAPITIKAEVPEKAVFTGSGKGTGLNIKNKSHIIVDGLKFVNFMGGITIERKSAYTLVKRCIFVNNHARGLLLYGNKHSPTDSHHHLFTENQFHDYAETGPGSPTAGKGISDYGIIMYFSTDVKATNNYFYGHHHQCLSFKKIMHNSVASNNVFDGFYYTAIYLGQNSDGKEGNLRSKNLIAEGNVFRPSKKYRAKSSVVIANVTNAIVRNNFVDSTWGEDVDLHDKTKGVGVTNNFAGSGIHIAPNSTGAKVYGNVIINSRKPGIIVRTGDCEIYNNTIAGCDWGLAIVPGAKPVVKNNIFYKNKVQVATPPRMETWNKTSHTGYMLPDGSMWKWKPETARKAVYEHNNWFPRWVGMSETDISVNPKFVGPFTILKPVDGPTPRFVPDFKRARAYRLKKDSPCIDKGVKTDLPFVGKALDIGAFEFDEKVSKTIKKVIEKRVREF